MTSTALLAFGVRDELGPDDADVVAGAMGGGPPPALNGPDPALLLEPAPTAGDPSACSAK